MDGHHYLDVSFHRHTVDYGPVGFLRAFYMMYSGHIQGVRIHSPSELKLATFLVAGLFHIGFICQIPQPLFGQQASYERKAGFDDAVYKRLARKECVRRKNVRYTEEPFFLARNQPEIPFQHGHCLFIMQFFERRCLDCLEHHTLATGNTDCSESHNLQSQFGPFLSPTPITAYTVRRLSVLSDMCRIECQHDFFIISESS